MEASDPELGSDPISAALPPNCDYLTYLTILEYQLTPERVPTLTKHLVDDDGTLAKEIGWDLVKLLLPLLDAAPQDAARCLEVVARRGNPREVVVRVAEALEILGAEDSIDASSGPGQEPQFDQAQTFQGEAERIHLGEMKLEGIPSPCATKATLKQDPAGSKKEDHPNGANGSSKRFSSLLSMLSLLHSRIKTQYPSRFLATSLPAALGAYRRIPISSQTTDAFLALLGKLSGKQRPALPPRSSTASVRRFQSLSLTTDGVSALLPDPEGRSDENTKAPSDLENSIVERLLQAVALEVLEEYLLAYPDTMEWSTRLYQKQTFSKALPYRTSRLKAWQEEESLASQDRMMRKFLSLAKDLRLQAEKVFKNTNLPRIPDQGAKVENAGSGEEKGDEEEQPEYPTSPSQIPYPHLGSLFLFLASKVPPVIYSDEGKLEMKISALDLHHFMNQFVVPTPAVDSDLPIPSVAHNQPPAVDALLSLLFLVEMPPQGLPTDSHPDSVAAISENNEMDYRSLIEILCFLSAEHLDPFFRTSAHHLATNLLHKHPAPDFRLAMIKSTIVDCGPFENLKEVAIGWLKDELLATAVVSHTITTDESTKSDANILASPNLFSSPDNNLTSLIFPKDLVPNNKNNDDDHHTPTLTLASPTPATYSLTLPIASLNLLFCLLTNKTLNARFKLTAQMTSIAHENSDDSDNQPASHLAHHAHAFLTRMQKYVNDDDDGGKFHDSMGGSGSEKLGKGEERQQKEEEEEAEEEDLKEEENRDQDRKVKLESALLALAVGRVVGALQRERED